LAGAAARRGRADRQQRHRSPSCSAHVFMACSAFIVTTVRLAGVKIVPATRLTSALVTLS
jgi:hypothetical protein